jgi:hypothetical protein
VRQCATCKEEKPETEYYGTAYNECKICKTERSKRNQINWLYGISFEEKQAMVIGQDRKCALCGDSFVSEKHTHLDHNHTTGQIRGVLCSSCNTGLGLFGESVEKLKKGIEYIERYAKENTATPVPTGDHRESEIHPELGTFSATWTREDYYDLDHYQRTVRGEDADYRTQARGGDGVGYGSAEVGTPQAPESEQDDWQLHPAYGWIKS